MSKLQCISVDRIAHIIFRVHHTTEHASLATGVVGHFVYLVIIESISLKQKLHFFLNDCGNFSPTNRKHT